VPEARAPGAPASRPLTTILTPKLAMNQNGWSRTCKLITSPPDKSEYCCYIPTR